MSPGLPLPLGLEHWLDGPEGADWIARLPAMIDRAVARWDLTLGAPFEPASISWVAPAQRPDGTDAVLKIAFPDAESEHEARALALWAGRGAARLLEHDPGDRALLLERLAPGAPLWSEPDDAVWTRALGSALSGLWRAPLPVETPFRSLRSVARAWRDSIPAEWELGGRQYDAGLVETAVDAVSLLLGGEPATVLLHQDLHGGNLLRDGAGWRAIDPKPLVGDPAFDLASALRDRRPALLEADDPQALIARRLNLLVAATGVDRERARLWGIVHALAWSFDGDAPDPGMVRAAEALSASR